jgi:hypothetical protein
MEQSVVEFIVEQLAKNGVLHSSDIAKANKMHKKQIEMAHYNGSVVTISKPDDDMLKLAEQYYKRTFKSK